MAALLVVLTEVTRAAAAYCSRVFDHHLHPPTAADQSLQMLPYTAPEPSESVSHHSGVNPGRSGRKFGSGWRGCKSGNRRDCGVRRAEISQRSTIIFTLSSHRM